MIKKGFLFLMMFFLVLTLAGCKKERHVLECKVGYDTFKYVYNEDDLVEYYFNGEKQSKDILELGQEAVDVAGGIEKYIENTEIAFEYMGGACEHK